MPDSAALAEAERVYQHFLKRGAEILFDDREGVTAGEKFADADLIGIPTRVLISKKTLAGNVAEVKQRTAAKAELVPLQELLALEF